MGIRFKVRSRIVSISSAAFLGIIFAWLHMVPGVMAADKIIPWTFGGYESIEDMHLVYWSASKDTIGNLDSITAPGFQTELNELWYSKTAQSFRVDKYEEMGELNCNEFKGQKWEIREQDGRSYFLKERVIQRGTSRTVYWLENILQSTDGREVCEYKESTGTKTAVTSVNNALPLLTFRPYTATPESEEMALMNIEMDEMMNPEAYNQTVKELKKTYDKVGRKTAKWSTNHGTVSYLSKGFVYVDLQWGIALEGYLTETQQTGQQAVKIDNPICIYRVISLDTKKLDAGVFSIWQ
ncbi:MAG: hypothetical protein JW944_14835 [Deltaproteobacteria bacterium]|nr:hypothetical protein [Deltaproteobacteria bacterium]